MENKRSILILTVILIVSAAVPAVAFEVIIDKEVKVKSQYIYLKDIAEFKGIKEINLDKIKGIDLGKAPLPGYKKYINKALVRLMLKKKGFSSDSFNLNFPDQIVIKRDAKQIDSQVISDFIKDKLSIILENNTDKYTLDIKMRNDTITIPNQAYSLEIIENREIKTGKMTVPIVINIEGEEYKRFYIPVDIKAYKKAYIAKRYIPQGSELKRADFTYKMVAVDSFKNEKFIEKETNIFTQDIELSYSLKQGDILKKNNYKTPYLINFGDRVQAKIIVGDVELTLMVVARERGKQGEYINVENPDNKHNFQAKVISPQLVELIKD